LPGENKKKLTRTRTEGNANDQEGKTRLRLSTKKKVKEIGTGKGKTEEGVSKTERFATIVTKKKKLAAPSRAHYIAARASKKNLGPRTGRDDKWPRPGGGEGKG